VARPRKQDGKRITLSTKVSEDKAAAVDAKRGSLTRAAYLEALIDADLTPAPTLKPQRRSSAPARRAAPVAAELARERARGQRESDAGDARSVIRNLPSMR
jgi:hypothetical protein